MKVEKREKMSKVLVVILLFFLCGCGATAIDFARVTSETYPPKPIDYDVLVFFKDNPPAREFKIIGMVYAEREANTVIPWDLVRPQDMIELLKEEAREQGADAIIDFEITLAQHRRRDWKRAKATAVIFE